MCCDPDGCSAGYQIVLGMEKKSAYKEERDLGQNINYFTSSLALRSQIYARHDECDGVVCKRELDVYSELPRVMIGGVLGYT